MRPFRKRIDRSSFFAPSRPRCRSWNNPAGRLLSAWNPIPSRTWPPKWEKGFFPAPSGSIPPWEAPPDKPGAVPARPPPARAIAGSTFWASPPAPSAAAHRSAASAPSGATAATPCTCRRSVGSWPIRDSSCSVPYVPFPPPPLGIFLDTIAQNSAFLHKGYLGI